VKEDFMSMSKNMSKNMSERNQVVYTFNLPIFFKCFSTEKDENVKEVLSAHQKGGIRAAVRKAGEITSETFRRKVSGDHDYIVELEVLDTSGNIKTSY